MSATAARLLELDRCRRILGVSRDASAEEIRQSWRDLVKVWHPDRFGDDPRLAAKASEKLKEINAAWETLAAETIAEVAGHEAAPASAPDGEGGDGNPLFDYLEQLRRRAR